MLNQAILSGAKGYLLKDSSVIDLTAAIFAVHRDNVYIGKGILDGIRLSSFDTQKLKIKNVNSWLAREIIHWWRDLIPVKDVIASDTIEQLNFNRAGLLQMKQHLCHQKDKSITLAEEAILKIEGLFAQIANSTNQKQKLQENSQLILNLLDENSTDSHHCLHVLQSNFEFLEAVTLKNVSKAIDSVDRQASPLPLIAFFQSVQKYLLDWQEFLEQEFKDNQERRRSALLSFKHVLQSRNKQLHKQNICRKAAVLAIQSKIDAEVSRLIALLVAEIIEQLAVQIDILNQTNNFLLESIEQLGECRQANSVVLDLYVEELQKKISIRELQIQIEESVGHPLNKWGICRSISHREVAQRLLEDLEPITREIYSNLRQEALAISFFEYVSDSSC